MAARLAYRSVSKRFGGDLVLDNLTLRVEPGEIFGFLGPNGAGKSTAIGIAMGLLRADSGEGELLGAPFARARRARAKVGYVPDAPVFFAGSALESVLFAARLNGTEGKRNTSGLRTRALELLRKFDLPAESKDARRFSRGMQQRLALAQAMVTRPELLILDEPTSALDPPAVMLVREMLEGTRREGTAVFFSSHQLHEVEQLCDRAAFLDAGRVVDAGPMEALLREGATVRITVRNLSNSEAFARAHGARLLVAARKGQTDQIFSLPLPQQRAFVESAWVAGAELVRVEREQRTLEDLFTQRNSGRGGFKNQDDREKGSPR